MSESETLTTAQTKEIRDAIGKHLTWRYEARYNSMLSEFAQNKGAPILLALQQTFPDEWSVKTIKLAPPELRATLGNLTKLTNEQQLFTIPATSNSPALVGIWWPWGHGGTYSLRVKTLDSTYDINNKQLSFMQRVKVFITRN